jgi:hypothetical protein
VPGQGQWSGSGSGLGLGLRFGLGSGLGRGSRIGSGSGSGLGSELGQGQGTVEGKGPSPGRRHPVSNQKATVSSLRDSEPLFRQPARAVRMCVSTVSRPDPARTGHACCRAPPRGHRTRWIHLRASKPGEFGRPESVAVWRPSRQARSFEGSGHLGPDDRARVQLESAFPRRAVLAHLGV